MSLQQSISALKASGWSNRRIARELGIHRETVAGYLTPKPAIPPPGSEVGSDSKPSIVPLGSEGGSVSDPVISTSGKTESKPAILPTGSNAGRQSQCLPFEPQIKAGWEAGLSAQRIYQDLLTDHQFSGSYDSVKRFVRRFGKPPDLPFRRMECGPAEQAQVDFGQGSWVVQDGKRRRPHLFRIVLSHSRKAYSEVVWQQTTENFIRCIENAFRFFGGVPQTLVIDNLRAAVKRVDWFEPELNPKVRSFCEHYGVVILPTKPAMPRHKGKVESGIKYVQNNALKKRTFGSLTEQNQFLANWEQTVADTRIHGTIRQQVGLFFESAEKKHLRALPAMVFPCFEEAPRSVHRDGHVEVARSYYSVPPEYVGRSVWARWDLRLVRIFNQRMEQIALHSRNEPGRFSTDQNHIHAHKRTLVEKGTRWMLERARSIGLPAGQWAEQMLQNRGLPGIRVLQGFLRLTEEHAPKFINDACLAALSQEAWHLAEVKALLQHPAHQNELEFLSKHPLIRDLSSYQELTPNCFEEENQTNEPTNTQSNS